MVLLWLVERSRVVQFLVLYCLECKRKKKTKYVESGGKDETDKMIENDRDTVEDPLPFKKDIQRYGYGYDSRRSSSSSEDDTVEPLSGGPSMLSVSHFYTIVINIGIKFSAYGFSDNKSAVQLQSVGKRKTCKELSALLLVLNKTTGKIEFDSKTMSFGFDAREKYGKLKSQEERNSCSFFPNIKVEESDGKFVVKDIAGNERNAEEILKCLISCLRTMAIHRIKENRNLPEPTTDNTTYLVVSKFEIPQKKEILTNAAIQAGIPDEHLKIIKEADTYSLYLRQVKDNMNCINCSLYDISKLMKVDDAYMVLDLGEGGANIVINVIKADETDVTKLHKYLEWGEESIRTRIIHVSVALFGQDCIDDLKEKHYSKYVGITEQIEHIKSKISLGEQGDITINLPSILDEIVKQKACQSLQNVVTTSTHKYAKYVTIHESEDNIKMEISPTILPLLLKPCIKKLIGCLQETASDEVGKVTFVYLIGGCANYKFMQEKVIKHFKNIPVILPSTPELVVVKGAPYHKDV